MPAMLLRARLVLADDGRPADAVLVRDGTIAALGRWPELAGAAAAPVLDLGELCLSPGFIDCHVHLTGSGLLSAPSDMQADSRETLLLRAAADAQRALAEGLTTLRDCGAHNEVIFPFREAARRGIVPSPRLLVAGAPLTRTGGHGHWWGLEADTPDEVLKAVRRQARAGADLIKVMVDGGIDLTNHQPGLLYFSAEELRQVVEEAARWRRPVAAHCLTAAAVRAATQAGVATIEHAILYDVEADATVYDAELVQAIRQRGIIVDPGHAFAYQVFADPAAATSFPRNARLFRQRLADYARMFRQGVRLVPGSDAGWYATPFGKYRLLPELMVSELGMSPREAFLACTRIAAEAIGLGGHTGGIAPGKRADLVAVEGDPRQDVGAYARVWLTVVDGEIRYDRLGVAAQLERGGR